ncbi:hypothetical protein GQR58_029327 [Nymphon striatum]|nr:hypothetical protein GQR58_029327 [Nymphon striatum]
MLGAVQQCWPWPRRRSGETVWVRRHQWRSYQRLDLKECRKGDWPKDRAKGRDDAVIEAITPSNASTQAEALSALTNLGYAHGDAASAVAQAAGDDSAVAILKGAIEAVCRLAGHEMAETDPELGSNFMVFFVRDWQELSDTPNLDKMIPELALVATALGLVAAIPAVIFYNKLSTDADRIMSGYEAFADEQLRPHCRRSGFFVSRETDLDVEVSNVSIISGEEFAAMQAQSPGETELPPAPEAPADVDQPAPAVEPEVPSDPPPTPEPVEPSVSEPDPVIPEPAEPIETPITPEQPDAPDVDGDPGATLIVPDARPVPRPADRIADEVVEQPDPDVTIDEVEQSASAPSPDPTPAPEDQEETAREESTTEIVTEADEPSTSAPTRSTRPGRKPKPPAAPAPQVAEATEPSLADSIANAVAEANTETAVAETPSSGGGTSSPITRQEKGALILGIQKCWNVGALGTDALQVSVVVGFEMEKDAKPILGSINLISSKGGSGAAVEKAYQAARRAIIRCGASGFNLPLDKYNRWREVEVSFNATNKELR